MKKLVVLALGVLLGWGTGSAMAEQPLKVGIVGLGGLGHMALKFAHSFGAHVVLKIGRGAGYGLRGVRACRSYSRLDRVEPEIGEDSHHEHQCGERVEDKLVALGTLREALPTGAEQGLAHASGLVGSINIAIADSFSLDLRGDEGRLAPVLHGRGDGEAPLLEPAHQEAFERSFNSAPTARPVYALSGQRYVVPQPPLRRALAVVRRINSAAEKR